MFEKNKDSIFEIILFSMIEHFHSRKIGFWNSIIDFEKIQSKVIQIMLKIKSESNNP